MNSSGNGNSKLFERKSFRKSLSAIITFIMVAGIFFASVPSGFAEGEGSQWRQIGFSDINDIKEYIAEPETEEPSIYSSSSEESDVILSINERLMDLDYLDKDEPSNSYQETTEEAVQKFERKNGFEMDGILTQYEFDLLMSEEAEKYSVGIGDSGIDVEELQERLVDLGFLNEVTGNYGVFTQSAVRNFQKQNSLKEDGTVGNETREKLYSEDATGKALSLGDENDSVKEYQKKLKELGYYEGAVNGRFSSEFRVAVKAFQSKNGLISDGTIGKKTGIAIMSATVEHGSVAVGLGDNSDKVREIQDRLVALGYMKSSTGYFGEKTENAVEAFQKNNNLTADGKVGEKTYKVLMSTKAKGPETKTETQPAPVPETTPDDTKTDNQQTPAEQPQEETKTDDQQTPAEQPRDDTKTDDTTADNKQDDKKSEDNKDEKKEDDSNEATKKADSSKVEQFIEVAKSKLGCKYVRGAKGPEQFDCSGFVYWCLNQVGLKQGYMTSHGWKATTKYPVVKTMGELQRGDIISYQGHVGIYLGNNQMIDASSSEGKVRITNIYSVSYWKKHFIKGLRVF